MIIAKYLEQFTHWFAKWTGSASGFIVAFLSIVVWLAAGFITHFCHAWESSITIYIGLVTFLMVFLIQRGQNKELVALQLKLNELIAASQLADNRMINAETLSEEELLEVKEIHSKILADEISEQAKSNPS